MTTDTIAQAVSVSSSIHSHLHTAVSALSRSYSTDGYGVIRDKYQVQDMVREAAAELEAARKLLATFERPTEKEYDAA